LYVALERVNIVLNVRSGNEEDSKALHLIFFEGSGELTKNRFRGAPEYEKVALFFQDDQWPNRNVQFIRLDVHADQEVDD
jgi:hypothetical protein